MYLEADAFLNELHKLFERKKKSGTVWITMKRSNQRPLKPSQKKAPKKQKKGSAAAAAAAPEPPVLLLLVLLLLLLLVLLLQALRVVGRQRGGRQLAAHADVTVREAKRRRRRAKRHGRV